MINTFVLGFGLILTLPDGVAVRVEAIVTVAQLTPVTAGLPWIFRLSILAVPLLPVACNRISVVPAFMETTVEAVVQVVQLVVAGKGIDETTVLPLINKLPGRSVPPPFE